MNEVMDNLSDCLLEVFDHFSIMYDDDFDDFNWIPNFSWRNNNNRIIIDCVPILLVEDIIRYIESKKVMIVKRFGYDIEICSHIGIVVNSSWITIRPLVPVLEFG